MNHQDTKIILARRAAFAGETLSNEEKDALKGGVGEPCFVPDEDPNGCFVPDPCFVP